MAVYAIGDLQGCLDELHCLLEHIRFDPAEDVLWFAGDLINRGPQSLETLRFVKSLGDQAVAVLGNHDLHLLAMHAGDERYLHKADTLQPILEAEDYEELTAWLRQRPLLHHDEELQFTMIHAGVPPQWSLKGAKKRAAEVEEVLRSDEYEFFLTDMYGNKPKRWKKSLAGIKRLRYITNCLTRLRFCTPEGKFDMQPKGDIGTQEEGLVPWFRTPGRKTAQERIVFGHWSTLSSREENNVFALDTGCLWGGKLTALRIDLPEPQWFQVECKSHFSFK